MQRHGYWGLSWSPHQIFYDINRIHFENSRWFLQVARGSNHKHLRSFRPVYIGDVPHIEAPVWVWAADKTCSFNNSIQLQNWNSHKYEPERSPTRYSYRTPASGCSHLFNAVPNQHFHVTNKTWLAQVHSNIVKDSTQLVVKWSNGSFHKPGKYIAVGDLVKPEQPCSDRVKQLPWFPPHGQLSQPN